MSLIDNMPTSVCGRKNDDVSFMLDRDVLQTFTKNCSDCSFKAINQLTQTREKWLVLCKTLFAGFVNMCVMTAATVFPVAVFTCQKPNQKFSLRFTSIFNSYKFIISSLIVIATSSQCLFVWTHGETKTFPEYKHASDLFQHREEKSVLQIVTVRVSHTVVNL